MDNDNRVVAVLRDRFDQLVAIFPKSEIVSVTCVAINGNIALFEVSTRASKIPQNSAFALAQ